MSVSLSKKAPTPQRDIDAEFVRIVAHLLDIYCTAARILPAYEGI